MATLINNPNEGFPFNPAGMQPSGGAAQPVASAVTQSGGGALASTGPPPLLSHEGAMRLGPSNGPPLLSLVSVPNPTPPVFERFHTFKQFMGLQKDSLTPERAVELYDQYCHDYREHQAIGLYLKSRDAAYVRDSYSWDSLHQIIEQKAISIRENAARFIEDLSNGKFDQICLCRRFEKAQDLAQNVTLLDDQLATEVVVGVTDVGGSTIHVKGDSSSDEVVRVIDGPPYFVRELNRICPTLVLRRLPYNVSRQVVLDAVKDLEGFRGLTLRPSVLFARSQAVLNPTSDVSVLSFSQHYVPSRLGQFFPLQTAWIEFETSAHCEAAELRLERKCIFNGAYTCHPFRLSPKPKGGGIHKFKTAAINLSDSKRIEYDLTQSAAIIRELDSQVAAYLGGGGGEKSKSNEEVDGASMMTDSPPVEQPSSNFDDPLFEILSKIENKATRLDLQLLYLRQVHFMDYYSAKIFNTEREMIEIAGAMTVRIGLGSEDVDIVSNEDDQQSSSLIFSVDRKRLNLFDEKLKEFIKKDNVYSKWLNPVNDDHIIFKEQWRLFCEDKTITVDAEKYRCGLCRKLFKGAEYVHKHLRNKHEDEVARVKTFVRDLLMDSAMKADNCKLLMFVSDSVAADAQIPKIRPVQGPPVITATPGAPAVASGGPSSARGGGVLDELYGPIRRDGPSSLMTRPMRSSPMMGDDEYGRRRGAYRDWDAPKSAVVDRNPSGDMRSLMRYDDL